MRHSKMILLVLLVGAFILSACAGVSAATPADDQGADGSNSSISLPGTAWQLISIQGQDVLEDTTVTLEFDEERAAGSAGCNSFSGDYSLDGANIQFGPLVSTMMFCGSPEGAMEQEGLYLETLSQTASFHVNEGQLELLNAAGETILVFNQQ